MSTHSIPHIPDLWVDVSCSLNPMPQLLTWHGDMTWRPGMPPMQTAFWRCQTVLVEGVSQLPNKMPCHWVYQITLLLRYVSNRWLQHMYFENYHHGQQLTFFSSSLNVVTDPEGLPTGLPDIKFLRGKRQPHCPHPAPPDKSAELHHLTSRTKQVCRWDKRWKSPHCENIFPLSLLEASINIRDRHIFNPVLRSFQ